MSSNIGITATGAGAAERGFAESDRAPDTYAEFLLRSRLTLIHEPPARRRACGRQVR